MNEQINEATVDEAVEAATETPAQEVKVVVKEGKKEKAKKAVAKVVKTVLIGGATLAGTAALAFIAGRKTTKTAVDADYVEINEAEAAPTEVAETHSDTE